MRTRTGPSRVAGRRPGRPAHLLGDEPAHASARCADVDRPVSPSMRVTQRATVADAELAALPTVKRCTPAWVASVLPVRRPWSPAGERVGARGASTKPA
jgi:hypothetical protein